MFLPRYFHGRLQDPKPVDGLPVHEQLRVQALVRFIRSDNGFQQLFLTGDNSRLYDGAQGIKKWAADGRYRVTFKGQRYGPFRASTLLAMDVLISEMDLPARSNTHAIRPLWGGARINRPPPLRCQLKDILQDSEQIVIQGAGNLELAARIPFKLTDLKAKDRQVHHFLLVEYDDGSRRMVSSIHPIGANRLLKTLSVFAFDLIVVPLTPRKPRIKPRNKGGPRQDERLRSPHKISFTSRHLTY
jgi:hypothetical protein